MSAHPFTPMPGRSGSVNLQQWRTRRLVEAGFPARLAAEMAADARVDLHALLELVDHGCPPEVAVRILSPLPPEMAP